MKTFKSLRNPRPERVISQPGDDEVTQPQFKDEVDINRIVKKFLGGEDTSHLTRQIIYTGEEFAGFDWNEYHQKKYELDMAFQAMNPYDREEFKNDPLEFVRYISNPKNLHEAVKRGFMVARPQEQNVENNPQKHQPVRSDAPTTTVAPSETTKK